MRQAKYPARALTLPARPRSPLQFLVQRQLSEVHAAERRRWRGMYVSRIVVSDAACAALAAVAGYVVRFGPSHDVAMPASLWMAITLPAVWLFAMLVARSYEERFLWEGPEEFRRIFSAAALMLATVGTVSWAAQLEVARGFVVVALPLATLGTLAQRLAWRRWLHRQRQAGRFRQRTLLVGHRSGVQALHTQLARQTHHGYQVIGCCLPANDSGTEQDFDGLRVLGELDEVTAVVQRFEVDTVAVLPCPELDGAALRALGWALETTPAELLLAPAVTEFVGPRVHIRPVCGLPLLHMERPELRGVRRLAKGLFDRSAAALGVLVLAPVLVTIALFVRLSSRGPAMYRQERVGRDGTTFSMLKFRTMVTGADQMLEMLNTGNDGNGVLFKLRNDPRVTRVGAFLRRYSLDELPQLFNVLRGEMSLVGPRPPLPSEVTRYGLDMRRRFLVKPGLTGLWQVSGRSDLSWDDSVRIDVMYVENWSLGFDLMILWKTLGAVVRGSGAY
jgi:exopolysaccharide biosynthesis polyprenyl glycosylphosphotransferase